MARPASESAPETFVPASARLRDAIARAVTIAGIANALNLDTGAQALILEAVVAAYDTAGTCAAPRP